MLLHRVLQRFVEDGDRVLVEGELHVSRADAPQLLSIKRGEWTLEQVKAEAERLFRLADEAYVRSRLPPKPDRDGAEKFCVEIIREYHSFR